MEPTVKIGFFGCGNVGSGVWKLLNGFSKELTHRTGLRFEVKRALVRDVHKKREIDLPEGVLTDKVDDLLNDLEISIILEFLGGEQPAFQWDLAALQKGKTLITANKVAFALHWHELQQAAGKAARGCITKRRCAARSPSSIPWRKACRPIESTICTAS